MTALRTETVSTLQEFTQLVEELMGGDTQLWFRGVRTAEHELKPSLYRHPSVGTAAGSLDLEKKLFQRFRERSIPYEERPFVSDKNWEYMFLMQHFGVPTRLLDWTENPFIGLYFAVANARIDAATLSAEDPAIVWILNPGPWNATALSDISFPPEVLSVPDRALEAFEPDTDIAYMKKTPVALYGLHNSPRIVAQRGVFTIFGQSNEDMKTMFEEAQFPNDTLVMAQIPENAVHGLMRSLFSTGITDSVVFPDLSGLALDIKRYYGFTI